MRLFELHRKEDETGISGTGRVAQGVVFDDGTVSMRWLTEYRSTCFYESIEHAIRIHGHNGKTDIVFCDQVGPEVDTAIVEKLVKAVAGRVEMTEEEAASQIRPVLDPYLKKKGPKDSRDWRMFFMCSHCFAEDTIDGHCLNCGAGGTTVLVPMWFIEDLRKNGSWVCKRYFANEEDVQIARELRALREKMTEFPDRTAELNEMPDGSKYWSIKQLAPNNTWIAVTDAAQPNDTPASVIRRTATKLPYDPVNTWKERQRVA